MWPILKNVLEWFVEYKLLTACIAAILIFLALIVYVVYLKRALLEKEAQINVLQSKLKDDAVLQHIEKRLGQNEVWQQNVKQLLEKVETIDNNVHNLNIKYSNDMVEILKLKKFPTDSPDTPGDSTVYDVCESPCICKCPGVDPR